MLFRRSVANLSNTLPVKQSLRAFATSTWTNGHKPLELLSHREFAETTQVEGSQCLGLFVGRYSEWRVQGLPWKLYKPRWGGIGREISKMEAIERISNNQPVKFQRCRLLTVIPDLKTLEQFAIPHIARLVRTARAAPVTTYTEAVEIHSGLPTMIHSLAELKLFTSIYNEQVRLPKPLADNNGNGFGDKNSRIINEQIEIANNISDLMSRRLESGLEFFTNETNVFYRFAYHFRRQTLFWAPISLVAAWVLASSSLMDLVGLESWFFLPELPDNLPQLLRSSVVTEPPDIPFTESSLGICTAAMSVYIPSRSLWLALVTPLGFRLTAYDAFLRISRRQPTVIQEVRLSTLTVPFITTFSWFTNYRPADTINSPDELAIYHRLQLMKLGSANEATEP